MIRQSNCQFQPDQYQNTHDMYDTLSTECTVSYTVDRQECRSVNALDNCHTMIQYSTVPYNGIETVRRTCDMTHNIMKRIISINIKLYLGHLWRTTGTVQYHTSRFSKKKQEKSHCCSRNWIENYFLGGQQRSAAGAAANCPDTGYWLNEIFG